MLEPVRPSRTVLSGKQARRVCASPPGPEVHRCTWSRVGGSPASAWASWHRVASPGPGPCSPPARHDASQEHPSGRGTDTAYSLACATCQEQSENGSKGTGAIPLSRVGEGRSRERDGVRACHLQSTHWRGERRRERFTLQRPTLTPAPLPLGRGGKRPAG